ncbi:MAG: hypothetical protein QNJ73_00425 [Gammaproteobacteria bacterium]|nr:hypothetical protein [Gammaproteobacteria bacterium]
MSLSSTDRLKALQAQLGLDADGILGPITLTALERVVAGSSDAAAHRDFSLIVSESGLRELIRFEISSPQYYGRALKAPTWPGGRSGITIGIGYDLGYNSSRQIANDWRGRLPDSRVKLLSGVAGLRGKKAKAALWRVRNVDVSLQAAREVFYQATLPRYATLTARAFRRVERLPADAQAMLLSLVYNRGPGMSGARREEMRAIRKLVAQTDLDGIAAELRRMQRLWDKRDLPGLHKRRETEARLVEAAQRDYTWEELIYL